LKPGRLYLNNYCLPVASARMGRLGLKPAVGRRFFVKWKVASVKMGLVGLKHVCYSHEWLRCIRFRWRVRGLKLGRRLSCVHCQRSCSLEGVRGLKRPVRCSGLGLSAYKAG
jgi:hypothetical protein